MTIRRMESELRDKWIRLLRSRKTKRGFYVLHTSDGRKCPVAILLTAAGIEPDSLRSASCRYYEYDGNQHELTTKLLKRVGLSSINQRRICELNDEDDQKLSEIADWIIENVPVK